MQAQDRNGWSWCWLHATMIHIELYNGELLLATTLATASPDQLTFAE
jgi:hypothetical protein